MKFFDIYDDLVFFVKYRGDSFGQYSIQVVYMFIKVLLKIKESFYFKMKKKIDKEYFFVYFWICIFFWQFLLMLSNIYSVD